jgi:LysR family transcriptional activator of nhaA
MTDESTVVAIFSEDKPDFLALASEFPMYPVGMDWLNYHHLLYFWVVAREGSMTKAAETLHVTQQTISGQVKALEDALGVTLFVRQGRRLVLTDAGRATYRYAQEIFTLGQDMVAMLRQYPSGRPERLVVGIVDALPKLIAYQLLKPALDSDTPVRLTCLEGKLDYLLADLAVHELDLILSDAPITASHKVRAHHHALGDCDVAIFGTPALAERHQTDFPGCLDGAPFLLPTENTALRSALDSWFEAEGLQPQIVGDFEDSALMMAFARAGAGVFVAPSLLEAELVHNHGLVPIGRLPALRERFFAITIDRKLKHDSVRQVIQHARASLLTAESRPAPL